MVAFEKEKFLAALRGGIKTVAIPFENVKDLEEIPQVVKDNLKINHNQGLLFNKSVDFNRWLLYEVINLSDSIFLVI